MKASAIRRRFLGFFGDRDHDVVPSAPLIPHNDPTLFFVNAGMVRFKDAFTGKERRANPRATSVQKCLRVSGKHNDLEVVGRTPRHHTFFEMLGNFSFGDYFKADAIPMAWELLTGDLGIDPARLWVTVHEGDDEAFDLWRSIGFPAERLQRLGDKDNFWSMGPTGPCGPSSEIFYDHGEAIDPNGGGPATESDRYVEIWNLVFMQYDQQADGTRLHLPRPSIDTGTGLERLAAVQQGVFSNYDTDLFTGIIATAAQRADVRYGADPEVDVALRVIADHARAATFLVGDGVMPSNEGRGYVLRRILRRSIRFGVKIGLERPFLADVCETVIGEMGEAYPEIRHRQGFIDEVVRGEEDRFRTTLDRGLRLLDDALERAGDGGTVPGEVAFTLSDTYGFPLDLTELIAGERGVAVDQPGYDAALEAQQARGRAAWKGSGQKASGRLWASIRDDVGPTSFVGYPSVDDPGHRGVGTVVGLVKLVRNAPEVEEAQRRSLAESGRDADGDADPTTTAERVDRLDVGDRGVVVLDRTPFYAESGGQVGDRGQLTVGGATLVVSDTQKASGLHLHHVTVQGGAVALGDDVQATVDGAHREAVRRNHTATHLLHAALREVLGEHVTQKGSLVAADRLRFDFAHHKPVSRDELLRIEQLVQGEILKDTPLHTELMELDAAKEKGAMALFGEKYDAKVRVVDVPGFSLELCGGTHVGSTAYIGPFHILSEGGVAAGVRRIEAQSGSHAAGWARAQREVVETVAGQLKAGAEQVGEAIGRLLDERKALEKKVAELERTLAAAAAGDLVDQAEAIGDVKLLLAEYDGDLKEQADRLRDQLGSSVVVLAGRKGEKVLLLVAATSDLAGGKVHAGQWIKELAPLVGGRGGGRPDLAQAGGKDAAGIAAAFDKARELAHQALG